LLIQPTTGVGARFVPATTTTRDRNAIIVRARERIVHVLELRPDICSLDIATIEFRRICLCQHSDHVERMARAIAKPE